MAKLSADRSLRSLLLLGGGKLMAKLSAHRLWPDRRLASTAAVARLAQCGLPVLLLPMTVAVAVADYGGMTMTVSPTTDCVMSGQLGGSFAPLQCEYVITTNHRWANVKVSGMPPWLVPSTTFGRTPLTLTLVLDQTYAAQQLDGNYSATITFSNVTAAQAATTHKAILTVTALPPSPPDPSSISSSTPPPSPTPTPTDLIVTEFASPSPDPTLTLTPSPTSTSTPTLISNPSPSPSGFILDLDGFALLADNGERLLAQ